MSLVSYTTAQNFSLDSKEANCDIVVLGHNRCDMSASCLYHLFHVAPGVQWSVTFVDNGSTDKTKKIGRWYQINTSKRVPWAKYPDRAFKYVRSKRNLGFAAGNNLGAKFGKAPWICFINNDAFPREPYWLQQLIACASTWNWAAIGPASDNVLGLQQAYWNIEWPLTHRAKFLSGFCFVVRRDVFESIGGWDEQFFNGDEDLDISIRIRKAGHLIGINRQVFVPHTNQATLGEVAAKQGITPAEWYARTRQQLEAKWDPETIRDLWLWPELTVPREQWRELGVLEDGFFGFFPGHPKDGARRLRELRARSTSGYAGGEGSAEMGELLQREYRFAGHDDCWRVQCGGSPGPENGKLELVFRDEGRQ